MRELKIRVGIDEKTSKLMIIEDTSLLNLPEGIDKEIYLQGVYNILLLRHNERIKKLQVMEQ